jgi:hypothetical protein
VALGSLLTPVGHSGSCLSLNWTSAQMALSGLGSSQCFPDTYVLCLLWLLDYHLLAPQLPLLWFVIWEQEPSNPIATLLLSIPYPALVFFNAFIFPGLLNICVYLLSGEHKLHENGNYLVHFCFPSP